MIPAVDFLSCYAIAVNEVNAAGGRIVTSPTNGAAGVIPAVLKYIIEVCRRCRRVRSLLNLLAKFVSDDPEKSVMTFLLTAAVSYTVVRSYVDTNMIHAGHRHAVQTRQHDICR